MIAHPYEALPAHTLRAATIGTAAIWGLLTLILLWAVPVAHIAEVQRLVGASEPAARLSILESWGPSVVASISFMIGFDFLYDVVHNNAVAFFALWGAAKRNTHLARVVGVTTAWVLWLDTGLNIFENLAMLQIIHSRSPDPLLPVVSTVFSFRTTTLTLGILVGVALHWSAWRSPQRNDG